MAIVNLYIESEIHPDVNANAAKLQDTNNFVDSRDSTASFVKSIASSSKSTRGSHVLLWLMIRSEHRGQ